MKLEELYDLINGAIDLAFTQEKYQLNLFSFLQSENIKRDLVLQLLDSSLCLSITHQIEELDLYLDGGERAAFVRESYSWMGKPRARKIREYLDKILEDAKSYEQSKRRGRKPGSKNRKKPVATANK